MHGAGGCTRAGKETAVFPFSAWALLLRSSAIQEDEEEYRRMTACRHTNTALRSKLTVISGNTKLSARTLLVRQIGCKLAENTICFCLGSMMDSGMRRCTCDCGLRTTRSRHCSVPVVLGMPLSVTLLVSKKRKKKKQKHVARTHTRQEWIII